MTFTKSKKSYLQHHHTLIQLLCMILAWQWANRATMKQNNFKNRIKNSYPEQKERSAAFATIFIFTSTFLRTSLLKNPQTYY